jgi:RNase P subunit RPR2
MEIPEVEDDHVNKSALLTCKRCGWEERLSDEMLERLVDAVLSLGPMP